MFLRYLKFFVVEFNDQDFKTQSVTTGRASYNILYIALKKESLEVSWSLKSIHVVLFELYLSTQ